uniref:Uncharacterized protein n=1 Tax=Arundo donax TaxID=35708 RepID=A0A0A9BA98_ARUDO
MFCILRSFSQRLPYREEQFDSTVDCSWICSAHRPIANSTRLWRNVFRGASWNVISSGCYRNVTHSVCRI